VQFVPTPTKEYLRYLEPQCLEANTLQLLCLQTLFGCQVRLTCTQRYAALRRMEEQLLHLQNLPPGALCTSHDGRSSVSIAPAGQSASASAIY
jgi:hypothetical protein